MTKEYLDKELLIREIDKQINFYSNSNPGPSEYCKGCNAGALAVLNWFKEHINMFKPKES